MTPGAAYANLVAAVATEQAALGVIARAQAAAQEAAEHVAFARFRLALTQECPTCEAGPGRECPGLSPFLLHGDRYEMARRVAAEIEAARDFRTM